MALYTVLSPGELAEVAARFGLPPPDRAEPEPRGRVNTSYHLWAGGRRWFLRVAEGKGEADVRFEAAVHQALCQAGFPAPRLRPAADGRPFAPAAGKPAMLFAYAPGEPCPPAEAGPERCRRVGEQLGRLHDLSGGLLPERGNPYGPACVAGWLDGLSAGPGEEALAAALPIWREESRAAAALPGAPRGLVHGDLFPDNVLWVGDRIAAVLDWEMSCTEAFAWDLAVAVDAWCYTDRHDAARARALLDGYRSRRALEPETAAALHAYARFQALRFALGRLRTFRGAAEGGAALGAGRVVFKDWRRYGDRLTALRAMGADGYRDLLGLGG
jgi:homoserine kinase type II